MTKIDYAQPDYAPIFAKRAKMLGKLRNDPELLAATKLYYQTHPWDFVSDWGMTFEPRNIERGLIPSLPFVLWPKQIEFLKWMYGKWKDGDRGLVEKSRDCGVTWLSSGFAVSMYLFVDGFTTGFGSRKEALVDKIGDSKCIFEKVRFLIDNTPSIFLPPSYNRRACMSHMRIINPDTGAAIIGEAGDEIGRGGRTSIYLVDEAAFVERQNKVDAALSQNTNCQIDISTPNGNGNEFYKKRQRFNNTNRIFVFDWRDDPRKDDAWYQKQVEEQDEVTVAQEIDRDYNASSEDSFIPAKWIVSCIDAHKKLGFDAEGVRATGFDPADTGDAKAVVCRHGSVIQVADQMKSGDITTAIPWAFDESFKFRSDIFSYDADGMGAPTMKLTLKRMNAGRALILPYYGSAAVEDPEKHYGSEELDDEDLKLNQDAFTGYKAQTWTWARDRIKATHDAVQRANEGKMVNVDPEDLVSISTECECWEELQAELCRPKRIWTPNGKIQVEPKPAMKKRGVQSPNLADAFVIVLAARRPKIPKRKPRPPMKRRKMRDKSVGY